MKDTYGLLINNEWIQTDATLAVTNPYSGEKVGTVCLAGEDEAGKAADAARNAFETMRGMAAYERAELLSRTADLIAARTDMFADVICREAGKPMTAARGEVGRAVATFRMAAEEATRQYGEVLPLDVTAAAGDRLGITRRFPIGTVLAISPFNFPLNLVAHKIAPALAVGNTVVHKPASSTPLTAMLLGEMLLEAGMPAGAVNVIPCRAAVAEKLVEDDRISMVSFTGSPEVGWHLKSICGMKKIALELGGNAAAIVEPDADIETAMAKCAGGGYVYAGQVCISLQRIYVHRSIYETFTEQFVEKVAALKTGDPQLDLTVVGPLISQEESERVHEWVQEARDMGGRVLTGGSSEGAVYLPTVLADVPPHSRCVCREVFGPVTVLCPYDTFDDALEAVNDSEYGLQAGVFTRDIEKTLQAFNRLEVGGVMVNEVPTFRVDNFPYGGVKKSGFGREGVKYAMEEMTEIKIMVLHNNR